jgi:hypothetical protein
MLRSRIGRMTRIEKIPDWVNFLTDIKNGLFNYKFNYQI